MGGGRSWRISREKLLARWERLEQQYLFAAIVKIAKEEMSFAIRDIPLEPPRHRTHPKNLCGHKSSHYYLTGWKILSNSWERAIPANQPFCAVL